MSNQNHKTMTLEQKIEDKLLLMPLVRHPNKGEINNYHLSISKVAEIADDYAIKFAEWLNEIESYFASEDQYHYHGTWHNCSEMLEIFKKEQKWK